jgi:hypothetical protein
MVGEIYPARGTDSIKMKINLKQLAFFSLTTISLLAACSQLFAGETTNQYWGVQLPKGTNDFDGKTLDRYGIPFAAGTLAFTSNGVAHVNIDERAKHIFLMGMTDTARAHSWTVLNGYSRRYFIGDEMGEICVNYTDGSTQVFPLVFGESLWWGPLFYQYPHPFDTDAQFRKTLEKSLRLYPAAPVQDGNYVAVIVPRDSEIKEIVFKNNPKKIGVPVISGITVESATGENSSSGIVLSGKPLSPEFAKFVTEKLLSPQGADTKNNQANLENLKRAFYTSDDNFKGHVATRIPAGYSGPVVSFKGDIYASILENAFYDNVLDITHKVTDDGMYHTSTKDAPNWSRYSGFGTFTTTDGCYYGESWSRDMGRSMQELADLNYTNETLRNADYCLRTARTNQIEFHGVVLPPHWGRIANKPQDWCVFENDGHGLVTMSLYKLWLRLPNRDEWLRARWPDVKAAGDWILWQLAHPEISQSTNGILFTTSEASKIKGGYSVYPDYTCLIVLQALAQMADSIGETNSAEQWRACAEKMHAAIAEQYMMNDPKYGRVWALNTAWPNKSTGLGPLILSADYQGFAPQDDDAAWHQVNEAAYQQLIDKYQPFGFYGQAEGYGQGFVTQAALLLDRMRDATTMLDWAAKEIYYPQYDSFIAPEGCDIDPTGRYWYRLGDLGNGVQEGEIIKMLRLVIGVDDTQPNRLQFYPRMPYDWSEMAVSRYPVLYEHAGKLETASLTYKLARTAKEMKLEISADKPIGQVSMRLGPFEKPEDSKVSINGKSLVDALNERSGDSWWVNFTAAVGPQ